MSKGKELWRAIKLFLLYTVIGETITGLGAIPLLFRGLSNHMSKEAILESFYESNYVKLLKCTSYLLIIIIFVNNRYVKMSLERMGRIAHMKRTTLWTAIGIAAMIGVGCFFSSLSFWEIIGSCESLFPEDMEELNKKLDAIGAKADQIDGLVSNLFVSTLEELEKLDVSASDTESSFLEKIFRDADYNRHIRKLDIPECIILCDTLRIEQVINNIIFNSYKYANTDIFVEGITEGDSLKVSITDRGGGVPVEELNLITQQYKRGSNSEGKQGAGLGLFISRELMENMQGSLEVANADGGLKVSLSFKLA